MGPTALHRSLLAQTDVPDQTDRVVLDMPSSERPVPGQREGSADNGHFETGCYHLLFLFNVLGDCLAAKRRLGQRPQRRRLGRVTGAGVPHRAVVRQSVAGARAPDADRHVVADHSLAHAESLGVGVSERRSGRAKLEIPGNLASWRAGHV